MKKLIIGTIGSILMIFVIWTIVGYIEHGENLVNYHLDLNQTFRQINLIFDDSKISGTNFIEIFRGFKNNLDKINSNSITNQIINIFGNGGYSMTSGFALLINAVTALFDPIALIINSIIVLVYIPIILLTLVIYACNFILGIWEFIFSPVFIPIIRNTIAII